MQSACLPGNLHSSIILRLLEPGKAAQAAWQFLRRYFLATHPKAMARLEGELDAVGLLKTAANPQPRTITFADIGKLHYLDLVIKVCRPYPYKEFKDSLKEFSSGQNCKFCYCCAEVFLPRWQI